MRQYTQVIVSNRLPISATRTESGAIAFNASSGGLATAMSSLGDENQVWVGWCGIPSDTLTAAEKRLIAKEFEKYGCFPVHLTEEEVQLFYEGYANDTLWPLFHYFQSLTTYRSEYWSAYKRVNKRFSTVAARLCADNGRIWVHDYQLMLMPKQLRDLKPSVSIGFFLHIPFPSYEIFRLLPERNEILEGLLGADVVGFHIYDYARHFLSSVLRLLGMPNKYGNIHIKDRVVKVDAYPIGIDYDKFVATRVSASVRARVKQLKTLHAGQKLILSVDRLDYSKGIPERLEAFRILLDEHPKFRGKVKLVVVAVPSRTEVETYKLLRDEIEQTVSRINGTYGTTDWAPISYQFQNLPFEDIVALYQAADVMLVTPLRDGMNLVAKEYVASKEKHAGVLVLSEMTGAVDELPEAIAVNPNNAHSIVRAITQGLSMPRIEQKARLERMKSRASAYTAERWARDFLEDLEDSRSPENHNPTLPLGVRVSEIIANDYQSSKRRLIILDYDGTLKPFTVSFSPHAGRPTKQLLSMLETLASQKNTSVYIVSGRSKESLDLWFKGFHIGLVAEHGAWTRNPRGKWDQHVTGFAGVREAAFPILEKYTSRTPGARTESKDFALVWHYRAVPHELAYVRAANLERELKAKLGGYEVGIHRGQKIIEIKPRSVHKGSAVKSLLAEVSADLIICAGDDYTDEDMFEALPDNAYTIHVGHGDTVARLRAANIEQLLRLLRLLSKQ